MEAAEAGAAQSRAAEADARVRRRIGRELDRLEALAARRRGRVRVLRLLRGGGGTAAAFGTLIKLKVAGSLALKLGLAVLVGLGFAWPLAALAILAILGVVLAIVGLIAGDGGAPDLACDCPGDCAARERRAERLERLIAARRAWLAAPDGPAPGRRSAADAGRAGGAIRSDHQ